MKYTENGVNSITFINALAWAKRKANKEAYSFNELVEETMYEYCLTADETAALKEKLMAYCKKNWLYTRELQNY